MTRLEKELNQKIKDQEIEIDALRSGLSIVIAQLSHLCQSDFIKGYTAKSNMTGEYLLDISEVDTIAKLGLAQRDLIEGYGGEFK